MSDAPSPDSSPENPSPGEAPVPEATAPQKPPQPHLSQEYRGHVDELLQGKVMPIEGTKELVEDLRTCAQKQTETRQSIQQASQFLQAKQSELAGFEGEATGLMRVLWRTEKRATRET